MKGRLRGCLFLLLAWNAAIAVHPPHTPLRPTTPQLIADAAQANSALLEVTAQLRGEESRNRVGGIGDWLKKASSSVSNFFKKTANSMKQSLSSIGSHFSRPEGAVPLGEGPKARQPKSKRKSGSDFASGPSAEEDVQASFDKMPLIEATVITKQVMRNVQKNAVDSAFKRMAAVISKNQQPGDYRMLIEDSKAPPTTRLFLGPTDAEAKDAARRAAEEHSHGWKSSKAHLVHLPRPVSDPDMEIHLTDRGGRVYREKKAHYDAEQEMLKELNAAVTTPSGDSTVESKPWEDNVYDDTVPNHRYNFKVDKSLHYAGS